MRNPLMKRIPRELKGERGKYAGTVLVTAKL